MSSRALTTTDFNEYMMAKTDKEKLETIRGEVNSALEEALNNLHQESVAINHATYQLSNDIEKRGFDVNLDDFRSGRIHKFVTEARTLQAVKKMFDTLDSQ